MKEEKIIIVDDSLYDLTMCNKILKPYYTVYPVSSVVRMFSILEKTIPDLIIMDFMMPNIDGLEAVRMIQANENYRNIPIMIVTSDDRTEIEAKAMQIGAIDLIRKPIVPDVLISHIKTRIALTKRSEELRKLNMNVYEQLRIKSEQIDTLQNAILSIVAELLEFRDITTGKHILNTQRYTECIIRKIVELHHYSEEVSSWDFHSTILSTQLHDIGKIGIPDQILNKTSRLTEEEFNNMKRHVEIGAEVLDHMINITGDNKFLKQAKLFIQYHHEKWDGTGYPYGLSGQDIPLEGRLLAIVDVYDALTSERPYKKALTHEEATSIISSGKGSQFDPELIEIFNLVADEFKDILEDDSSMIRIFSNGSDILK